MKKSYLIILFLLALALPNAAFAYIGPGAGFAFLGSTFVFVLTILMALVTLLLWPLQLFIRKLRGYGVKKNARAKRVVIVGLDGLEPKLVDKFIAEGRLPNLKRLAEQGSFNRLGTTLPALSPVAWSSFQTGVNPGAHNIFDFLTRDKRACLPLLASTKTEPANKFFSIGKWKIPLNKSKVIITRKSQPFWKILGKYGIFSNVIRVPISYPPEKFSGNILSAMCTPDIRGTQGSFTYFSTHNGNAQKNTGGEVQAFERKGNILRGKIEGPPDASGNGRLSVQFELVADATKKEAKLKIGEETELLKLNQYSRWIEIKFPFGRNKEISGIARFCLREIAPEVSLYITPININPENPAMPIAHPVFFSTWLAKRQGPFGTLGLMEDTWGRNELVIDDQRFLDQTYLTHAEREVMFFDALERTREGVCVCVFDASDRIQHMFWRYLDEKHPSPKEGAEFSDTIGKMYERMDALVGKVLGKLKEDDALFILSDHGFASFRRCININTWLLKEGYLVLKDGKSTGADYLMDVDWAKTKAFALGLSGLYINKLGREANGIVSDEQANVIKAEIAAKLEILKDPQDGTRAIRKVHDTAKAYKGLYVDEAPDLIVGYEPGYRVSWDSITGTIEPEIFSDNMKAWSGDHHVEPELIPGILFSNRKLKVENPHIVDLAPTTLDLFSVKVPAYMEGRVIA